MVLKNYASIRSTSAVQLAVIQNKRVEANFLKMIPDSPAVCYRCKTCKLCFLSMPEATKHLTAANHFIMRKSPPSSTGTLPKAKKSDVTVAVNLNNSRESLLSKSRDKLGGSLNHKVENVEVGVISEYLTGNAASVSGAGTQLLTCINESSLPVERSSTKPNNSNKINKSQLEQKQVHEVTTDKDDMDNILADAVFSSSKHVSNDNFESAEAGKDKISASDLSSYTKLADNKIGHTQEIAKKYRCKNCNELFGAPVEVRIHMRQAHRTILKTADKIYSLRNTASVPYPLRNLSTSRTTRKLREVGQGIRRNEVIKKKVPRGKNKLITSTLIAHKIKSRTKRVTSNLQHSGNSKTNVVLDNTEKKNCWQCCYCKATVRQAHHLKRHIMQRHNVEVSLAKINEMTGRKVI